MLGSWGARACLPLPPRSENSSGTLQACSRSPHGVWHWVRWLGGGRLQFSWQRLNSEALGCFEAILCSHFLVHAVC